jgi:hypothetical protein
MPKAVPKRSQPSATTENPFKAFAKAKIVEEVGKVLRTAIVAGCVVGIAYYCARIVHDLAGRTTAADIGIKFLGTLTISEGLAYAIAAVCVGFGYQRGRTNRSMAKRLARLSDLERSIDPNRSSSHLTNTGVPREEDR